MFREGVGKPNLPNQPWGIGRSAFIHAGFRRFGKPNLFLTKA